MLPERKCDDAENASGATVGHRYLRWTSEMVALCQFDVGHDHRVRDFVSVEVALTMHAVLDALVRVFMHFKRAKHQDIPFTETAGTT